ncbi:MAG: S9 family peptidase [Deltaproteobacteria bacterium]|nr:S9 family peptidase [Deltaproteobacteria bacterium]
MSLFGVAALTCLLGVPLTPERVLEVQLPAGLTLSADGNKVVYQVAALTEKKDHRSTHLHLLDLSTQKTTVLTRVGSYNGEAAFAPNGAQLAFVSDRDGEAQVYLLDLAGGGDARPLTNLPTGASGPSWSPDGRHLLFVSRVYADCPDAPCNRARLEADRGKKSQPLATERSPLRRWNRWNDGRVSHLFVVPTAGGEARDLTPGPYEVPPSSLNSGLGYSFWGPNQVVYAIDRAERPAYSTNHDLEQVALGGGEPRRIFENPAWDGHPLAWNDVLLFLSTRRPGYESDLPQLQLLKPNSKPTGIAAGFDFPIADLAPARDGRTLFLIAYRDGRAALHRMSLRGGPPEPIASEWSASALVPTPNGGLIFIGSRADRLPEVRHWDPAGKKVRALTALNAPLESQLSLGRPEVLSVKSSDGVKVPGYLLLPPGLRPGQKVPLVVLIHGGPQGAWLDAWSSRWNAQIFAAAGYAVAMPNIRGSIGYGQAYTDAIRKDWAGQAYRDLQAFVAAVEQRPAIDGRYKAAAGASYGGYLVSWIAGHSQDFQALVAHGAVFNLESMWGETDELWFPEWELGGPPFLDPEPYRRWSPHHFIQNAKTPTLVLHGQLDFRVPHSQGVMLFTSLERLGVPTRLVSYPDEGHWILKPTNYVHWNREMLGWLDRHLRPGQSPR